MQGNDIKQRRNVINRKEGQNMAKKIFISKSTNVPKFEPKIAELIFLKAWRTTNI